MAEEKNNLGRALFDLLKAALYIALLLFGLIICFFGVVLFAGISSPHKGPNDTIVSVVISVLVEGFGVLMLFLAGRLIGKEKSKPNIVLQVSDKTNG